MSTQPSSIGPLPEPQVGKEARALSVVPTYKGPPRPGPPVTVGPHAQPFTLRLDFIRRAKLERQARQRNITPSQLLRDLIDEL